MNRYFSAIRYLVPCVDCGANTSKTFARTHNGQCKACVTGVAKQSLVCPDCGEHTLTLYQKRHGYHCDNCTRQTDPEGWIREMTTPYEPEANW